jgi:hypothetical protein
MNHVRVTNAIDAAMAQSGQLAREKVRSASIEATVDSTAMLVLPADLVERLGLRVVDMRPMRTSTGAIAAIPCVGPIDFEILGRRTTCDALVIPSGSTPRIGHLQLVALDLVVDPLTGELRVASAEHIIQL